MKNRPALKLILTYLIGIILADRFNLNLIILWGLAIFFIAISFVLYKRRFLSLSSVIILLSFMLIGFLRYEVSVIPPKDTIKILNQKVNIQARVLRIHKTKSGGSYAILKGNAKILSKPSTTVNCRMLISFWEHVLPYNYGDVLEFNGQVKTIQPPRNFGAFDFRKYMMSQRTFVEIDINKKEEIRKIGVSGIPFIRWINKLQKKIELGINQSLPLRTSAVLKGFVLGNKDNLSESLKEKFRRTGTSHVLTISGLHMGIIATWSFFVFDFIRKILSIEKKIYARIPVILIMAVYACMVGFRFPALRTLFFAVLILTAGLLDRDVDMLNLISVAALSVLIIRPGAFFDASFRLSFGIVASITIMMPYWDIFTENILNQYTTNRLLNRIRQFVGVSLSASLASVFLTAYIFRGFSTVSLPANILVVFLAMLIVPLGFILSGLSLIWISFSRLLGYILHMLISLILIIIGWLSSIRCSYVENVGLSLLVGLALLYIILAFLIILPKLLKRPNKLILSGFGILVIILWGLALTHKGNIVEVTFLDVGHGDSIFIDLPGNRNILIDGGLYNTWIEDGKLLTVDKGKSVVIPFLRYKGVNNLDMVVSTHPHSDHVGGLISLIDEIEVKEVLTGSYGLKTSTYRKFLEKLNDEAIPHREARKGNIFSDGKISLNVVSPENPDLSGTESSRMNNNSVVIRFTYNEISFLFTGDIQEEYENILVNSGQNIKANVLKIPHQGSLTSSSWEFLKTVQPDIGLLSISENNAFGHPAKEIMNRYEKLGVNVYRTDKHGAVKFITDGKKIWIKTML
ncbi:DNA internalization-related competence protein ComEC/Rec2 [Candidatus Poribacteria bacterium]|nr:DNA internalization-related competence protein ComEC/Rec2 [Candidatus Poribacteria bacterium]